ncbi:MAG: hypothetical protein FWD57_16700 [Polyangiaceae bacterium]|nr:hypothetical protein [Polyangiaceae bacterium]
MELAQHNGPAAGLSEPEHDEDWNTADPNPVDPGFADWDIKDPEGNFGGVDECCDNRCLFDVLVPSKRVHLRDR